MLKSGYDTAQICTNGHCITASLVNHSEFGQQFCSKCGAATISNCPDCNVPIRGHYWGGVMNLTSYLVPSFCHNCGKPYPWTQATLKSAQELSDELENLTEDEREQLKKSLDDIVKDTPQTAVAATRFKKLAAKAGQNAAGMFKEILVNIISESAKKIIWPS